jgi:cell shape-determining protein MreC
MYDSKNELMQKLLVEMNDLLAEVEQVENEMQELMKQL